MNERAAFGASGAMVVAVWSDHFIVVGTVEYRSVLETTVSGTSAVMVIVAARCRRVVNRHPRYTGSTSRPAGSKARHGAW